MHRSRLGSSNCVIPLTVQNVYRLKKLDQPSVSTFFDFLFKLF